MVLLPRRKVQAALRLSDSCHASTRPRHPPPFAPRKGPRDVAKYTLQGADNLLHPQNLSENAFFLENRCLPGFAALPGLPSSSAPLPSSGNPPPSPPPPTPTLSPRRATPSRPKGCPTCSPAPT